MYNDIPQAHKLNASLSAHCCPVCGGKGKWRSGQEFDNEKICWHGDKNNRTPITWCPSSIEYWREEQAELLIGMSGDNI